MKVNDPDNGGTLLNKITRIRLPLHLLKSLQSYGVVTPSVLHKLTPEEANVVNSLSLQEVGVRLTTTEFRILGGVLTLLNRNSFERDDLGRPGSIELSGAEFCRVCGVDPRFSDQRERLLEALIKLNKKLFIFHYERKEFVEESAPSIREVASVGTIIASERTYRSNGNLKSIRIEPSSIFFDQEDSYFVLVPEDYLKRVRECLPPGQGIAPYLNHLLYYLLYAGECSRRANSNGKSWRGRLQPIGVKKLASKLKMEGYLRNRKFKLIVEKLKEGCSYLQAAGLVLEFDITPGRSCLNLIITLNPDFLGQSKPDQKEKLIDLPLAVRNSALVHEQFNTVESAK